MRKELGLILILSLALFLFLFLFQAGQVQAACTDEDGGKNPDEKGICEETFPGRINTYEDSCVDKNTVKEYYCELVGGWNICQSKDINCGSGKICQDGACVTGVIPGIIRFENPLKYETFDQLVNSIINFIFTLSLILVPLIVIIGAFYILTAGGEERRLTTGKNIIYYSLIGFAIILLAKGLVFALKQILGG